MPARTIMSLPHPALPWFKLGEPNTEPREEIMAQKTCIEVAVNGASTRRVQPRIPVSAKEIIDEGVACIKAGAAVIHAHTLETHSGKQNGNVDNCVAFMNGIREQVDISSSRFRAVIDIGQDEDVHR